MEQRIRIEERFLSQSNISWTVFHQQDVYGHAVSSNEIHAFISLAAKANRKVDPAPRCDSTEIVPPCLSTIFLQMASPMPVPANSSRLCSRWNMPKILSKYCGSIPNPLSCTENFHRLSPSGMAEMCTVGISGRRYLIALPTRFWKS